MCDSQKYDDRVLRSVLHEMRKYYTNVEWCPLITPVSMLSKMTYDTRTESQRGKEKDNGLDRIQPRGCNQIIPDFVHVVSSLACMKSTKLPLVEAPADSLHGTHRGWPKSQCLCHQTLLSVWLLCPEGRGTRVKGN